ncbi:MAG: VWA domain-containing protein [Acidobacteriota bacterium]
MSGGPATPAGAAPSAALPPASAPPARQSEQQIPLDQRPTFGAEVEMVTLHVAVFDAAGTPVPGLTKEDFTVFEDGAAQEIALLLTPNETPLDIALTLDTSGSIERDAPTAKHDAYSFLNQLSGEDCVYLLPFNERVGPGRWGSGGDADLKEMIVNLRLGGNTALYDALLEGLSRLERDEAERLVDSYVAFGLPGGDVGGPRPDDESDGARTGGSQRRQPANLLVFDSDSGCGGLAPATDPQDVSHARRRALVVLTDGVDTSSMSTFSDTLITAWEADVPVFPIAIGGASHSFLGDLFRTSAGMGSVVSMHRNKKLNDQLKELARITGGRYIKGGGAGKLSRAYDQILNLLRASYVVGYYPPPLSARNRRLNELTWHKVKVKLRKPHLKAITRAGYYRSAADPKTASDAVRTGVGFLRASRPADALLDFDRALRADAQHWEAYYYRAIALGMLERWEEARKAIRQALALSPETARAQELAWLLSYNAGDYQDAWEHAIRAQQSGQDMSEEFALLRQHSAAPADLDARLDVPRVYVDSGTKPDLVVQEVLKRVLQAVRGALANSPKIGLVTQAHLADYLLVVDAKKISGTKQRKLDGEIELYGFLGDKQYKHDLTLRNIDDPAAIAADLERHIADLEKWFDEHQ